MTTTTVATTMTVKRGATGLRRCRSQGREIPGFNKAINKNGWIRVLPRTLWEELSECNGLFVARLVKVGYVVG